MNQSQATSSRAVDVVKAPARTQLEEWFRWLNWTRSLVISRSVFSKKIEVKTIDDICPQDSAGRARCEGQGEHSWFNHNMDLWHSNKIRHSDNLPEGYKDL